jgi:hypothetical protein
MAETLRFIIDGQDRGQPLNWKEFGCTIQMQRDSNGVFTTFDNDLIFSGGVYAYLIGLTTDCNFCNRIDCVVVNSCNDDQRVLVSGFILLSDCEFDLDRCQVTTKFIDDAFQSRINNNKSIEISFNTELTKNGQAITEPYTSLPNTQRIQLFRCSDGVYLPRFANSWSVYLSFQILVAFMSDNEMDFQSDYFETGAGKIFFVTSGRSIIAADATGTRPFQPYKCSFVQLYDALNKKLELGFGFQRSGTRPVLRIEPLSYFENNPAVVQLLDVPGVRRSFDQQSIYAAIELGSDQYLEEWQGDNNTVTLSFPQVPFRGFKGEQFGLCGECNVDNVLNLRTNKVVFDTNIIENIIQWSDQNWNETPIIIQVDDYSGSADTIGFLTADKNDIFGIGTFQYNSLFTNEYQAARNINGVPCSINEYYQGLDPSETPFAAEADFGVDSITFTQTPAIQYYSDPNRANSYFPFSVLVLDAGGNYDVTDYKYVIPSPGIYTFFVRIKKAAGASSPAGFEQRIMFKRLLPDGTLVKNIFNDVQTLAEGTAYCAEATESFFCNAGDIVVVDIEIKVIFATSAIYDFSTVNVGVCDGLPVIFSGSGIPLQGGELEPTDGSSFQAEINKFRYPLSRSEITELINDTTKGLAFTRSTDATSLKTANISRINIPSIHKGLADIELKNACNDGISLD